MRLIHLREAAFVKKVNEIWKTSKDHSRDWRVEARDNYRFQSGNQWDEKDRAFLEENKRPVITFNRVHKVIESIKGTEILNRQETRFLPRTTDDAPINDMYTEVSRWIRQETDAEDEESRMLGDAAISGMGWTETWIDFESDIDGKIRIERFSPLEGYWDPSSTKQNLADAKWVGRLKEIPIEDARDLAPDKRIVAQNLFADPVMRDNDPHVTKAGDQYADGEGTGKKFRRNTTYAFHFQWFEPEIVFRVRNQDGQDEFLTASEFKALQTIQDVPAVRHTRRKYYQATILGRTVISRGPLHPGDSEIQGFTLNPITAYWDETERDWFGVMRLMKDPQQWANKFFSQFQDIVNATAKGGIIAEKGAFENTRDAEERWANPESIVWAADGAIGQGKIQERPRTQFPAAVDRMMQLAIQAIPDASGVNLEFLGLAGRTQSGVVEAGRVGQGMVILASLFNSLRRYRKEQGQSLLHMIRTYVPPQKAFRLTNNQAAQFIPVDDAVKFDIIVDQAPSSPNMKQEVWQGMQQIMPALLKAGLPIPPDIIDFLPLPQSVIENMKAFYQSLGPSEEDQQVQKVAKMLELQGMQADNALKQANAIAVVMKATAAQKGVQARVMETIAKSAIEVDKGDIEKSRIASDVMTKLAKIVGDIEEGDNGERT